MFCQDISHIDWELWYYHFSSISDTEYIFNRRYDIYHIFDFSFHFEAKFRSAITLFKYKSQGKVWPPRTFLTYVKYIFNVVIHSLILFYLTNYLTTLFAVLDITKKGNNIFISEHCPLPIFYFKNFHDMPFYCAIPVPVNWILLKICYPGLPK